MVDTTATQVQGKKDEVQKVKGLTGAQYIAKCGTVSGAIRELFGAGMSKGQIAKFLDKRYQHVRNVLLVPVKNPKPAPTAETK